jgi:uncharacterized protein YacL
MIEMPKIDVSGLLPVAGLVLVVVLVGLFLVVRSLLNSRVAMLIAVVIGIVATGPTLAQAATAIVGTLVPLFVAAIVGGVTLVFMVQRNPELMSLVRDLVTRRSTTSLSTPPVQRPVESSRTMVIDQLPAPRSATKRTVTRGGTDDWGLR